MQKTNEGDLRIIWNDGHLSNFTGEWLHNKVFTQENRRRKRILNKLKKVNII